MDIVAVYADSKKVLVGEVKRQRKNFKPEQFLQKVELLRKKLFFRHDIETGCFTMDDM